MVEQIQPGTLYVVATPVGNLEDISYRAVRILTDVDLVAAEDTRTTRVLMNHLKLKKTIVSYHDFNERQRTSQLITRLKAGSSVALVSDAGTPGISDPGFLLIREAIRQGIPIIAIPGPAAFLIGLVASGIPTNRFVFEGFLPAKKGRKSRWERIASYDATVILYESPHRLLRTLQEALHYLGNRETAVARELTKKFEEVIRGRISDLIGHYSTHKPKGEFVIIFSGISDSGPAANASDEPE